MSELSNVSPAIIQTVTSVAEQEGVSPALALAIMMQESAGNPQAVGDGGTSFGLFQLHEGGDVLHLRLAVRPHGAMPPAASE